MLRAKNGGLVTSNVADICFPVSKVELSDLGFGSISSSEYAILADIKGQNTILNTCSNRYELVTNDSIFGTIESTLQANGMEYEPEYEMHDYSVFKATYLLKNCFVSLPNGDKIYLKFEVTHSYNGLSQYTMILGYWRLVCTNGLVIPLAGHEDSNLYIRGKHTENILHSIEKLMDTLSNFIEKKDVYADRYRIMADRSVSNWHDRVIEVMSATGINEGKKQVNLLAIQSIMQMELNDRLGTGNKVHANDWLVYNAINEGYVYNDQVNSIKPHLRIEKDAKVIQWIYDNPSK